MIQNFSAYYCQFQPYIKYTRPVISFPNLQDGGSSQKPGYHLESFHPPNFYNLPVIFPNTTNKHNLKAAIPLHFLRTLLLDLFNLLVLHIYVYTYMCLFIFLKLINCTCSSNTLCLLWVENLARYSKLLSQGNLPMFGSSIWLIRIHVPQVLVFIYFVIFEYLSPAGGHYLGRLYKVEASLWETITKNRHPVVPT